MSWTREESAADEMCATWRLRALTGGMDDATRIPSVMISVCPLKKGKSVEGVGGVARRQS